MADRLDDLICTFHPGASAMETLAILLLGWIIFGAVLTLVGRFLYSKLLDVPKEALDPSATPPPLSLPATTKDAKSAISNKERFINDLKTKPPPTLPKVARSRSSSTTRSVERVSQIPEANGSPTSGFPIITGSNADCVKWVTGALSWLFKHPPVQNDLIELWKDKLNALTKISEVESGVCVELDQIIFSEESPPCLTNVFCEITPFNERATVTSDFESHFAIQVKARRDRRDHKEISEYWLQVDRFRGRINFAIDFRDLSSHAKFDGWPEVRLRVVKDEVEDESNEKEPTAAPNDEELLMDIIVEMVTSALRAGTLTLKWSRYPDFPKFVSQKQVEPILPVHYDSMLDGGTRLISVGKEKKLLVKVIKANNLGSNKGCHEVHCIIEMDEPPQRHQTTSKKDTVNPFWDENFLFDLGSRTEEILFELYDRFENQDTFLGLGIVGMEELLMNPSQRQIIPLQARPYENDPISGTLTLEFLFIDPKDVQGVPGGMSIATNLSRDEVRMSRRDSYKRATKRSINSTPLLTSHTAHSLNDRLENALKPLKEIEQQQQPQAQQQQPPQPMPRRGNNRNSVINPYSQRPSDMEAADATESKDSTNVSEGGDLPSGMGSVASSLSSRGDESMDRVRSRGPKRSFFRNIKDRMSRSKNRSRSVDPDQVREDSLSRDGVRSVSADRARSSHFLMVPGLSSATGDVGSARSSLSEVSATSNTSTRTFLDEASTLVLEAIENDIKKHYLIPMALADKRQWKKKGTKLHIFSDHIFVARHLPGGTACQVCGQPMARRPGKQGYECRDCLLRCHKPCHVKVDTLCPNSTVHFMDLEFVEDTSAERKVRRN